MLKRYFIYVLLAAMLLSLSACGFRMRGAVQLPKGVKSVYIQGGKSSQLIQDIELSLEYAGVKLLKKAVGADAILTITNVRHKRRVLSVGTSGRALEYQLTLEVDVSLVDSKGTRLIPRETMRLTRDYRFDENAVLGKSSEESLLWKEMERDMAQMVLRRISASRYTRR